MADEKSFDHLYENLILIDGGRELLVIPGCASQSVRRVLGCIWAVCVWLKWNFPLFQRPIWYTRSSPGTRSLWYRGLKMQVRWTWRECMRDFDTFPQPKIRPKSGPRTSWMRSGAIFGTVVASTPTSPSPRRLFREAPNHAQISFQKKMYVKRYWQFF